MIEKTIEVIVDVCEYKQSENEEIRIIISIIN